MTYITPESVNAIETLLLIAASGRKVTAEGESLFVSDRKTMPAGLVTAIKRNKAEILGIVKWSQ